MRLLTALIPLADSRYRPFQIFDGDAIRSVKQLREVFDERFSKPRESHPDRFSWDPWHVTRRAEDAPTARVAAAPEAVSVETDSIEEAVAAAGRAERGAAADDDRTSGEGSGLQYSMLRTPAAAYFPEAFFEEFCQELAAVAGLLHRRARNGLALGRVAWPVRVRGLLNTRRLPRARGK